MIDAAAIKESIDLLAIVRRDTPLKRVATTNGGEWAGPCPFCGGRDRFRVWPAKGRFWCRQCAASGDVLSYIQIRDQVGFREACESLLIHPPVRDRGEVAAVAPVPRGVDRERWLRAAGAFVAESERHLWGPEGEKARHWLHERGLRDKTIQTWRLGFNPSKRTFDASEWGLEGPRVAVHRGVVIPCWPDRLRYVKVRTAGQPKYLMVRGSQAWLFGAETFLAAFDVFIFEGEFDAMLAWQESRGLKVGFGAFPANKKISPEWLPYLAKIERFLVCHDMDPEGRKSAERLSTFTERAKIARLPFGNDLTDFWRAGGDVFEWLYEALG